MTQALCLSCGEIKFGAFCPCPTCETASTGDIQVDILFSDHVFHEKTLEDLGLLFKAILARAKGDQQLCFSAFIQRVQDGGPRLFATNLPPDARARVEGVLQESALPSVTYRQSDRRLDQGYAPWPADAPRGPAEAE